MSVNLDFQCSRVSPSKVVGPGGAVQYFPRPYGPSIRSGLASTPNSADATGALLVPANPSTDGQQLHVQASGTFGYDGGDPSGTVTVALYAVTGSLTGRVSYTEVASTGAMTPFYAIQPWALDATLTADSVSQMMVGHYTAVGLAGALNSSPKGIDFIPTGISFYPNNALTSSAPPTFGNMPPGVAYGLVVGVTFGTPDASNKATMTQFQVS